MSRQTNLYDDDGDSGDISLSLSGTRGHSLNPPSTSISSTSRERGSSTLRSTSSSREPTIPPPSPAAAAASAAQRLFGKSLFSLSPNPSPTSSISGTGTESKPTFSRRSSAASGSEFGIGLGLGDEGGVPAVSLNDDDEDETPIASTSFWGLPDVNITRNRSLSANPPRARRVSASPVSSSTLGVGMDARTSELAQAQAQTHESIQGSLLSPTNSGNGRPTFQGRRTSTSTTLGRSRSLNVRLPSVDLSSSSSSSHHKSTPMSATSSRPTPSSKIGWSRRPGEPRPPPLVSESTSRGMSRWIKEVVVCNFDLERGPVVERRAGGRRWGPGEKENVAFSSFPDTSLFAEGSILFSFKIRHIPPDPSTLSHPEPPSPMPDRVVKTVEEELLETTIADPPGEADVKNDLNGHLSPVPLSADTSSNSGISPIPSPLVGMNGGRGGGGPGEKAAEYRLWDERGREWLYGYVWFEQRRDKAITRGYMQKSLVILTHFPFPTLFAAILQRVAPVFFEYGYSALEAACHSIANWPDPVPDTVLELPLMSHVITTKLPDMGETPQVGIAFGISSPAPSRPLLASLPTSTPLRAFASFLPAMWSLWECLILAEPVLVIAPDPKTCSEIVWWLREMMRPIPPAGDFRPYLHIHDHDFSLLVNSNKPQPGVVVGVTNPFFRNAASHWPNVISIPPQRPRRTVSNGVSPAPTPKPDQPEGFISRRHRSVQKDRALLKRLEALVAEGQLDDPEGNEALRTHFQRLTESFLVPLNRYFQTLVPTLSPSPTPGFSSPFPTSNSSSSITSNGGSSGIRPFSLPTFLSHIKTHGPNPLSFKTKGLSTKTRVENDFYASFCMSATFARWLSARVDSLGLAVALSTSTSTSAGATGSLAVPSGGGMMTPKKMSPSSSVPSNLNGSGNVSRPGMTRQASIGLGISGNPFGTTTGGIEVPTIDSTSATGREVRKSPSTSSLAFNLITPNTNTQSESERSEADDESGSTNGHWRLSEERPSVSYAAGESHSHSGRRASEGFVKFTSRSTGR